MGLNSSPILLVAYYQTHRRLKRFPNATVL